MKKVYLVVSSIVLSTLAFGQVNKTILNTGAAGGLKFLQEEKEKPLSHTVNKAAGDILYSQDFSSGTLDDMTTSGPNASVWQYDLDGGNGQYSGTGNAIVSPTAGDGFAIFDADAFNATTSDDLDGNLESPAIDLSAVPGATLSFYSKYRSCCAWAWYPKVQVSTDNFASYEEFDVRRTGILQGDVSGTHVMEVQLSKYLATATNKSNFKFRFAFNQAGYYYWQIDDISVVETSAYDVRLEALWLDDINQTFEHTDVPTSMAGPLTVQAHLINRGHATPTNTQITITVFNSSGTQVATETGGTLNNNFSLIDDTITFISTIDLSTLAVGTYSIDAEISINETDADTDNDTLTRTLVRTDFELGQTNHDVARVTKSVGRYYGSDPDSDPMIFGNVMYIPNDITLHGLEVTIANGTYYSTTAGGEITVKLYQMDYGNGLDFTQSHVETGEDRFFTITPEMIPAVDGYNDVVLNFHESTTAAGGMDLTGGNYYMVGVSHPGGTDNHFAYACNARDDDYSSHYQGVDPTVWYTISRQVHTRMIFDPQLEIDASLSEVTNNGLTFGNIAPNPTTGQTSINYKLDNASIVSIKVLDITGKIVYTSNEGTQTSGSHTVSLDASSYTTGLYYVTVTTENGAVTKKLIKK